MEREGVHRMTGQLSALAQGRASGAAAPYGSLVLKTGQTTQYNSELDDGYYEAGVAKSYTVNTSGAQSGTTNVDMIHLSASTAVSFDAGTKEIRGTGIMGIFKAGGGETIVVSGAAQAGNNGVFTTVSATADKIVVTEALTDESAGSAVTIKKRETMSNNTVLDNNTGLVWMRYYTVKMGIFSDGRLPVSGYVYDAYQWVAACNAASVGGYTDWRLPNIFELLSIADFEASAGYPDGTAFPSHNTNVAFLSSNTVCNSTTLGHDVYYQNPYVYWVTKADNTTSNSKYVTLVRGGI